MKQLELNFSTPKKKTKFVPKSVGRFHYKNFSIHEKINWKSHFENYLYRLMASYQHHSMYCGSPEYFEFLCKSIEAPNSICQ